MRPFLTDVEKRWVVYQLLQAIVQCRDVGITHGDIKSENVVVTSWNWVLLTDFEPFKPGCYLPATEPAPFDYYFDTSGRQSCYIAPNNFRDKKQVEASFDNRVPPAADIFPSDASYASYSGTKRPFQLPDLLKYSREGVAPTSLTTAYEKLRDSRVCNLVEHMLQRDPASRFSAKKYIEENTGTDKLFPEYFGGFMFPFFRRVLSAVSPRPMRVSGTCVSTTVKFLRAFSAPEMPKARASLRNESVFLMAALTARRCAKMHPQATKGEEYSYETFDANPVPDLLDMARAFVDELQNVDVGDEGENAGAMRRVLDRAKKGVKTPRERLQAGVDKGDYIKMKKTGDKSGSRESGREVRQEEDILKLGNLEYVREGARGGGYADNGLIVVISFLCSCIRRVRFTSTKLTALWMLHRFALLSDDEAKLQRVVPYVVSLLSDEVPYVRCTSLRVLVALLLSIETLPPFDSKIFPEYLLPALMRFPNDPSESVRLAFAECVPKFAQVSKTFLELSRLSLHRKKGGLATVEGSYDRELNKLREEFEKVVARMVAQSNENSSLVKMTLLKDVTRLCVFFGNARSNNFLLPMLITFLNERDDWQLRATFFEVIPGVSSL